MNEQIFILIVFGLVVGILVGRDAYTKKMNPWFWGIFCGCIALIGIPIYLIERSQQGSLTTNSPAPLPLRVFNTFLISYFVYRLVAVVIADSLLSNGSVPTNALWYVLLAPFSGYLYFRTAKLLSKRIHFSLMLIFLALWVIGPFPLIKWLR